MALKSIPLTGSPLDLALNTRFDNSSLPEDCLLSNWWSDDENKPWLIADERDKPAASEDWQIAARYFYRQHKTANHELLKKDIVSLVLGELQEHRLYKRGDRELPSEGSIKKILQNIEL